MVKGMRNLGASPAQWPLLYEQPSQQAQQAAADKYGQGKSSDAHDRDTLQTR